MEKKLKRIEDVTFEELQKELEQIRKEEAETISRVLKKYKKNTK